MPARAVNTRSTPIIRQQIEMPEREAAPVPTPDEKSAAFWERIAEITPEQWGTEYICYLYRDAPRANTKGPGYVQVLQHAFDIEWVRQEYGGYDYRALLNHRPSGKIEASVSFSIDAPSRRSESQPSTANPQPASANGDAGFQSQVLAAIRESNSQTQALLLRLVENRGGPPSADLQATALDGIVTMLTKQVPEGRDPLALIKDLKSLMPEPPDMLTLLGKAKELFATSAPPAQTGNMVEQLNSFLEIADKLGGIGGAGRRSVAATIVDKVAEHIPQLVEGVKDIAAKWAKVAELNNVSAQYRYAAAAAIAQRPGALSPGAPPQTIVQPVPQFQSAPVPQPGVSALDVEPVGASPDTQVAGQPGEQILDLLAVIKDRIVASIAKGEEGGVIVRLRARHGRAPGARLRRPHRR